MERLKTRKTLLVIVGLLLVIIVIAVVAAARNPAPRAETYKDVTGGAAGLHAKIDYDCHKECKEKFNFNVYILAENGHQVSVVRPDQKGNVYMALPEGTYIMLVAKQVGKDNLFPQERITLKNGKELELKLHYKEGIR